MRLLAITDLSDRAEANLIAGLARRGVDVDVVCDTKSRYHTVWESAGIPVTKLDFRRKFDRRVIGSLRTKLARGRYDMFHGFSGRALSNAMVASGGMRMARVAYCGTTDHLKALDPACRLTFHSRRMLGVMCVSHAVRRYLAGRIPARHIHVVYKGHDPAWYTPHDRTALDEFGIPKHAFVVSCTANVRPVKGVNILVHAMSHVPRNVPLHLLAIGEVRDQEVRNLARELGVADRITFAGFRHDATSLAGATDACVMPSIRSEGFPKAVLEGMCQNLPSVVTQVGGLPELVVHGETGLVVPPRDPKALATAMTSLAADRELAARMGRAGRARVQRVFSPDVSVDHALELYSDCLRTMQRPKWFGVSLAPVHLTH